MTNDSLSQDATGQQQDQIPRVSPRPRRPNETRKLAWKGQTVFVTIGYRDDHVTPCEIFYASGYRAGSDMEVLVGDLCIALSVMLQQQAMTIGILRKSMSEAFDMQTGKREPASILGLLLEELGRPPEWSADLANGMRTTEGEGGADEQE